MKTKFVQVLRIVAGMLLAMAFCVIIPGNGIEAHAQELTITTQPEDIYAAVGSHATMSIGTSGGSGKITYTWQCHYAGSTTWNTSWGKGATFTTGATVKAKWDGLTFRCIVTDEAGNSVTSEEHTLRTGTPLTITTQPEDISAAIGSHATMSIGTSGGSGKITYTWQCHYAGSTTWNTSWGTGATFTTGATVKAKWDGLTFRCIVTDEAGNSVTSEEHTLRTGTPLTITTQPEDISAAIGSRATMNIGTSGGSGKITYTWQCHYAGSTTWNTSWGTGATFTTGVTVKAKWDGLTFRCIVTDEAGNSVTSEEHTLKTYSPLKITTQPEDISAAIGSHATMSIGTSGGSGKITYTWQCHYAGSTTWNTSWGTGKNFTTGATVKAKWDGLTFRCIVTDETGNSVTSEEHILTLEKPEIVPSISIAYSGDSGVCQISVQEGGSFTLMADASNANAIEWQSSPDGENFTAIADATGTQYSYTNNPAPDTGTMIYYRAVATSETGNTAVSNVIGVLLLTVDETPLQSSIEPEGYLIYEELIEDADSAAGDREPAVDDALTEDPIDADQTAGNQKSAVEDTVTEAPADAVTETPVDADQAVGDAIIEDTTETDSDVENSESEEH